MATASLVFSGFVDKVSFINKLPTLMKATSDDGNPTPGYLYQEITNISFESNGYCQCLLDHLVDRLEKKSYHVKLKVLRIIKHTVVNGNPIFAQGLRRSSKGIKDATKFTGPPDPLHGNSPYIAVRKAAEELLEILFDTERSRKEDQDSPSKAKYGSPGIGATGVMSSRMEGFGNTVDTPKKTFGESVLGNIKDFAENMMDPYGLVASKVQDEKLREYQLIGDADDDESSPVSTAPKYTSSKSEYKAVDATLPSVPSNPDLLRVQQSAKLTSDYNPGKAGGGWDDERDGSNGRMSSGSEQKSKDSTDLAEKLESVSVTDWSQETRLVEEITTPGGVKPIPSRDALTKFTKRSATLNCEKIVELLNDKLTDQSSQVQLKSLCVLEYLLKADLVSTEDMCLLLNANLLRLSQESQGSTSTKAKKILRQLESVEKTILPVSCTNQNSDQVLLSDIATPCSTQLTNDFNPLVPELPSPEFTASSRSTSSESFVTLATDHMETETQISPIPTLPDDKVQSSSKLFSGMSLLNSTKTERTTVNDESTKHVKNSRSSQANDFLLNFESENSNVDKPSCTQVNEGAKALDLLSNLEKTGFPTSEDKIKTTQSQNPLMSRTANMSDLLVSMGMTDISSTQKSTPSIPQQSQMAPLTQSGTATMAPLTQSQTVTMTPLSQSGTATVTPLSQSGTATMTPLSQSGTPPRPPYNQMLSAYPQLSNANLSVNSTVPIKIQQSQPGSFAFLNSETDKTKKSSDAFSFVQDAMKASHK